MQSHSHTTPNGQKVHIISTGEYSDWIIEAILLDQPGKDFAALTAEYRAKHRADVFTYEYIKSLVAWLRDEHGYAELQWDDYNEDEIRDREWLESQKNQRAGEN